VRVVSVLRDSSAVQRRRFVAFVTSVSVAPRGLSWFETFAWRLRTETESP